MESNPHSDAEESGSAPPPDPADVAQRRAAHWIRQTNRNPDLVAFVRRARRMLPGDPEFGDPLSVAGDGAPRAAARTADRLLPDRDAASREVGLAGLQMWQALTERVSRRPANSEVTIVFTDLVGFSTWSLEHGDEATLLLLRRVAAAVEPPLLERGGHIVKRMGDGIMAVFGRPAVAVGAALAARDALKHVEVQGYTPRMRMGIHTGRPQRIGSDWLGVDVNIAARVMGRATRGGIVVSDATLALITAEELDDLGVTARRVRRQMFARPASGVPADLTMYWLRSRRDAGDDESDD